MSRWIYGEGNRGSVWGGYYWRKEVSGLGHLRVKRGDDGRYVWGMFLDDSYGEVPFRPIAEGVAPTLRAAKDEAVQTARVLEDES